MSTSSLTHLSMFYSNIPGHLKALTLTAILFSLAWIYGCRNFYRDPGSIFYDPHRAVERRYSLYRQKEADSFRNEAYVTLQDHDKTLWHPLSKTDSTPSICAVVVTVGRMVENGRHPLELVIASALANLYQAERDDLDLRIYFANTDPSVHPLWDSWLLRLVERAVSAEEAVSSSAYQVLLQLEKESKFHHKAGLDFSYALQHCYDRSYSPFIAIFEEDIIFANGWFAQAKVGLQDITERTRTTGKSWLDMRLFNAERSVGWASTDLFGNNVPIIFFSISTTLILIRLLIRRYTGKPIVTNQTLFGLCCITIPAFVVLFYQAGKSSLLPPSPGIKVQSWGCCTQGLVLLREQVPGLVHELQRRAFETATDIIVRDYARDQGLLRYALDPVQVQHMGFESVLSPDRPKDEPVWSIAFEDLVRERLEKDHREMVSKLYGANATSVYFNMLPNQNF